MKVAPHKFTLTKSEQENIEFYYNGWRKEGVGYVNRASIGENKDLVDKYKILIPKAWGVGKVGKDWINPFIVTPPSVCTETYLVVGAFDNVDEAKNVVSYMQTKFFHILVSLLKISQNAAKGVYQLVPQQDFTKPWEDMELYSKYRFTAEEIHYIEATFESKEDNTTQNHLDKEKTNE